MEELNEYLDKTLPSGIENMIATGGILVLSVIIVMLILFFKRWRGRIIPLTTGIISYCIFGFIFTNLCVSALAMIPSIDMTFRYNTSAYSIVLMLFSIVGFTIARAVCCKFLTIKYNRQGDVYMAGLGIAIGEAVLMFGLSALTNYSAAIMINNSGLDRYIEEINVNSEQLADFFESTIQLYDAPVSLWLIIGLSAVIDIFLNVILMTVFYGAYTKQINYMWITYTAIAQMLINMFFQVYDATSIVEILVCFGIKLAAFAAAAFYAFRYLMPDIKFDEK